MKVTIMGFGHVGSSLWKIERKYHSVSVYDKSQKVIKGVPGSTTDIQEALHDTDVVQICFPVSFKNLKPNLKSFLATVSVIAKSISDEALVIVESTVPVTTTQQVAEILKNQPVAHSPVRGAEPHMVEDIKKLPKIVGGINEDSTRKAVHFYESVNIEAIPVANPRIAELFKLVNNVWQDINIAYANEWTRIAAFYNVDPDEIIQLMRTSLGRTVRTYGYVGGHCVPTNSHLLTAEVDSPLIATARETNEKIIERTIEKVRKNIKSKKNARVAVVGLSYKPGTSSLANSPGIKIIKKIKRKASILVYDPLLDQKTLMQYGEPAKLKQLASVDIIINCHSLPTQLPKGPIIINAKNIWKNSQ
jgi:nucleotide sugar dehydrogenase